uniref:Protein roadkill n=1 Tax=Culex pipiens TaxID=7175 RepID=A0A8D8BLS4_CULPI
MEQACTTEALSVTFHNVWKICNFSNIKGQSLKSNTYYNLGCSVSWHYVLNITGTYQVYSHQRGKHVSAYAASIVPVIDSCNSLATGQVEIDQDGINRNHNNTYGYSDNKEIFKISEKTKAGSPLRTITIERETFMQFFKEDTLTLRLKFTLLKQPAVKSLEPELLQNYTSLLSNEQLSDVTIQVSKHKFYAQRAVLSIRSPVFAAMFQSGMQESQQNLITIKDIRPEVVQEVLRFIYTGEVIGLAKLAHELLAAADKYSLEKLRRMCETHLMGHLEQETILKTLVLADLYHAQELKDHAIQFICENIKTMQGTNWKGLCSTHPDLVADIFNKLSVK